MVYLYRFLWVSVGMLAAPIRLLASEPRPSPFMRSVISRARAECNCVWANSEARIGGRTCAAITSLFC